MEKFTVRFAHLEERPDLEPGEVVRRGDRVGRMGNTHLDVVYGTQDQLWRLSEVDPEGQDVLKLLPSPIQCAYFVDRELWGGAPFHTTTYYCDPAYKYKFGKWHCGYDLVGHTRDIHWNRSKEGLVTFCGWDGGYGWTILVAFGA